MKGHIIFILVTFILLLNVIISEGSNIQEMSFITTLSSELFSMSLSYDGPPAIPNVIFGYVYINEVKISSENDCTLTLKINDQVHSTYKIGEDKKCGDLYKFLVPAYSQNIDIFVLYNETLTKAYSISSMKTAEIIRHDIYIVTNREPEPPKLLAQLTSERSEINVGGTTYERTVFFMGYISDPDNDKVKLQVEIEKIKDFSINSSETNLYESDFYESNQYALLSIDSLDFASYKWRARTIDQYGNCSDWVYFGDNDIMDMDFAIEPCLKLSETRHNFGNVEIGACEDWELSISNLGNKSIIINQISSNNSAFIAILPSFPYQLPANSVLNVKIRFVPVESINYSGTISVITDEFHSDNPENIGLSVILTGIGKDGKPDLAPISITFPKLPIVMEKSIINLTIKNNGTKRSQNSQLKLKLFVYDENGKPLQGNILDIGNIESIQPGKSTDVSFTYIFISSELSSYLDIEILPKNSMDSDYTNNVIRIENFRPEPNSQPSLNFVGDLLTIAGSALLDGTETKELIENIISYAYEQLIENYDLLITETDIEKIMTLYYRTVMNTYRNVTNLKGRSLILRCLAYAKLINNNISNQKYPPAYRVLLKNLFESFWRMIVQKNDRWEPWELFLFLLHPSGSIFEASYNSLDSPAGLIVEDSSGRVTSVIHGEIIEGIENSYAFYFEGQIAIAIIGGYGYRIKVKGLSDGQCALTLYKPDADGENLILKKYENITIYPNSQAELDILSGDSKLIIDTDNDGIADGSFVPDFTENIALEDIQVTIPLSEGWNLISIPVLLENNLSSILQSIAGKYQSVWAYENKWKRHFANAKGKVNDLDTIEAGKGYWINMVEPAELVVKGKQIINMVVQLNEGWNLVGYTSIMPRTTEKALAGISNHYQSIWSYDGSWKRNIVGARSNTLNEMLPGKGYWINVTSACQWNIRSYTKQAPSIRMNALQTDIPQIPCVIFGKVFINHTLADSSVNVLLKVNGNIYSSCKLENGHYLLEFPQIINADLSLYVQYGDVQMYAKSIKNPLAGELNIVDLSVGISSNSLYQNFPNPFNPETWIPFSLRSNSRVTIQIFNMSGQLIRTLDLGYKDSGHYTSKEKSAYWDGTNELGEKVSSGIYFYTIITDDFRQTRKMILLR